MGWVVLRLVTTLQTESNMDRLRVPACGELYDPVHIQFQKVLALMS
jgi:hypothetical protein